jgi:hypothetical protein
MSKETRFWRLYRLCRNSGATVLEVFRVWVHVPGGTTARNVPQLSRKVRLFERDVLCPECGGP